MQVINASNWLGKGLMVYRSGFRCYYSVYQTTLPAGSQNVLVYQTISQTTPLFLKTDNFASHGMCQGNLASAGQQII